MKAAKSWFMAGMSGVLVMIAFILVWSYSWQALNPLVTFGPRTGEFMPSVTTSGGGVKLCRDMHFARDETVSITRYLELEREIPVSIVEFGNTLVERKQGLISQCRYMTIPEGLPVGVWTLHTYMTYQSWPFWKRTIEAPPVNIRIIPS